MPENETLAVVVGASGGIGAALAAELSREPRRQRVVALSRRSDPPLDLLDEASIAEAARFAAGLGIPVRLVVDATGFLHDDRFAPERRLQDLDLEHMLHAFRVNAIGPALLMKHFLPLLPRDGRSVFATISAKVGSIGDNRLGGWYSYRASKAALNQLVRTASIELRRRCPEAACVALHPGTVDTRLSAPFGKAGLELRTPAEAARLLVAVLDTLQPAQSGGFFDYRGQALPW
ncbi:SDR family NAD(P)-dependent oxidoreductase [Burkholderiaceae bacterium FT117]|uniref:SDR family NAD(P)-dependent oxidoreductase n=1 Tax=Zeimonas sediminis TaxID=2944268 RepID=UPI002342BE2F|nr:SDR family NAD(P)-dependent oxidoreductase [Zeimonas sediminis]MCM5569069.1 SDR family NAD(P)-dependent oxidoreductase [Zeimonas sediminis]